MAIVILVAMPQVALTIAGFDPSGGAGISADLAVFAAHGLYGTACITALTVQSTRGVRSVQPVAEAVVRDTLQELEADLPPAGVKIGMLASGPVVDAVADFLQSLRETRLASVVLDPVLRSSSGYTLLDPGATGTLRERLLPVVDCITPNLAELSLLVGYEIPTDQEAIEDAARELQRRTSEHLDVIVTGGDLDTPDDLVLPARGRAIWLSGERIASTSTHGTGCAFSSALLSALLRGKEVRAAAREAKGYVQEAIRRAPGLGAGKGPLAHLWPMRQAIP